MTAFLSDGAPERLLGLWEAIPPDVQTSTLAELVRRIVLSERHSRVLVAICQATREEIDQQLCVARMEEGITPEMRRLWRLQDQLHDALVGGKEAT